MTIESSVRNKVIELHTKGKKRDAIAKELNQSGIKISTGSVSNVISSYRRQNVPITIPPATVGPAATPNMAEQRRSSNIIEQEPRVTTFTDSSIEQPFLDSKDIRLEDHLIPTIAQSSWECNGYNRGGPLSWFVNGHQEKAPEADNSLHKTTSNIDLGPSPSPPREGREGTTIIQPAAMTLVTSGNAPQFPTVNNPDNYLNNYEQETAEIEKDFAQPSQHKSTLRNLENSKTSTISDEDEEEDNIWDKRLLVMLEEKETRHRELQLIEQKSREIEAEKGHIAELIQNIDQRENDLKVRENKIADLAPSVKQLQQQGVPLDILISFNMILGEKASQDGTDIKTAAFRLVEDFGTYRNLGGLKIVLARGEQQLKMIYTKLRIGSAVEELYELGYTTRQDIMKDLAVIHMWREGKSPLGMKQLDTEIGVKPIVIKQLNGINRQSKPTQQRENGVNGNGHLSETDKVKLCFRRNALSDLLNRTMRRYN
jgi:hypothetical protein